MFSLPFISPLPASPTYEERMKHVRAQDEAAELLESALKKPSAQLTLREALRPINDYDYEMQVSLRKMV